MRTLPATAAISVLLTTIAAGCGGSSGGSGSTGSPAAAPAPTSPSALSSAAASPLEAVAFTAAEATRYGGQPVTVASPAATGVGAGPDATLDLCGANYPSEALRLQRYQVSFAVADDPRRTAESNEIVRYRAGATAQAYREVVAAARRCRPTTQNGVRTSRATVQPRSPRLVDKQLTVALEQSGGGSTVYLVDVYQYQGDLFDGTYVARGTAADALAAARALAAQAAHKLRAAQSTL